MSRFNPRERRLLLITVMAIGCWLLVSGIVVPLKEWAGRLHEDVESRAATLDSLGRLLARRASIDQEYAAVEAYITGNGNGGQATEAGFLAELEQLAQTSGLQINLKPKPMRQDSQVNRIGVELDLHADESQLIGFLDAVLQMPALIEIQRLHISGVPGKPGILRAQLHLEKLALLKLPS